MGSAGRDVVSRVILDVCRGGRPTAPPERLSDELVAMARHHRVAPLVHVALRPAHAAAPLRLDRDLAILTHVRALSTLAALDRVFANLPWVTFKGPVLSETAHPIAGLRTYHDVDVLVPPLQLRDATDRLSEAGWTLLDFDDMLRNPETTGELHWVSPTGLIVDLHWSMINMAERRRRFVVPTGRLLERRVHRRVGSQGVWTLHPADALVHVGLHGALSGANRMLLLLDAHHLAVGTQDWDEVVRTASAWRAGAQLNLVLSRAHRHLGTPIPAGLADRLGVPSPVRWLGSAVDRLAPVPAARREEGAARLFARGVRSTTVMTVAACARSGTLGVGHRLSRPRSSGVRVPASASALRAYLTAVERQSGG